jgi:hypothetical protein
VRSDKENISSDFLAKLCINSSSGDTIKGMAETACRMFQNHKSIHVIIMVYQ